MVENDILCGDVSHSIEMIHAAVMRYIGDPVKVESSFEIYSRGSCRSLNVTLLFSGRPLKKRRMFLFRQCAAEK